MFEELSVLCLASLAYVTCTYHVITHAAYCMSLIMYNFFNIL